MYALYKCNSQIYMAVHWLLSNDHSRILTTLRNVQFIIYKSICGLLIQYIYYWSLGPVESAMDHFSFMSFPRVNRLNTIWCIMCRHWYIRLTEQIMALSYTHRKYHDPDCHAAGVYAVYICILNTSVHKNCVNWDVWLLVKNYDDTRS
jgi:hypothetical protein